MSFENDNLAKFQGVSCMTLISEEGGNSLPPKWQLLTYHEEKYCLWVD